MLPTRPRLAAVALLLATACGGDESYTPADGTGGSADTGTGAEADPSTDTAPEPSERTLHRVDSLGWLPAACDTPTSGEFELAFSLVRRDGQPIRPGDDLDGTALALGSTFGEDDFAFGSAVLTPAPAVECGSDSDCRGLGAGFACVDTVVGQGQQCGVEVTLSPIAESLRHDGGGASATSVAVALANGATILGVDPESGAPDPGRSTDPDNLRIDATIDLFEGVTDVYGADGSTGCVSWFTGEGSASVSFLPNEEDCVQPLAEVMDASGQAALRRITLTEEGIGGGQRSHWAALGVVMDRVAAADTPGAARHVVLLTDGPDDGSNAAARQTPESMAGKAQTAGFGLHVVQLDPDIDGRHGPLAELGDVACQSGGTYMYASSAEDVVRHFRSLRAGLAERYVVGVRVDGLSGLPSGAYLLQTEATLSLHGSERPLRLGVDDGGDADNRLAVWVP